MRIAIINWSRRKVGGAEIYLDDVIPELLRKGHRLAFLHEVDEPANREQITLPDGVPAWCVSGLGAQRALAALRDWQPDLVYAHGLVNAPLEAEALKLSPAVFCAHAYYGTCISGAKTFKNPIVTPCSRRFGWQCLLHYYPHRCGGWSPLTMMREYWRQSNRLELLRGYQAIVTLSEHMRSEYIRHGFAPDRVHNLFTKAHRPDGSSPRLEELHPSNAPSLSVRFVGPGKSPMSDSLATRSWRLLFLGRMDLLKGGQTFLNALPRVAASLDRPLRVTFAGDGPSRGAWERRAARVRTQTQGLSIEFVGWVDRPRVDILLTDCDLLVLPSLWPEPFGRVATEAGLHGVPTVAFAVGGIPERLIDGGNGGLAPGDPPSVAGLAEAIIRCLRDPTTHASLRRGAAKTSQIFSVGNHLTALLEVFEEVRGGVQIPA